MQDAPKVVATLYDRQKVWRMSSNSNGKVEEMTDNRNIAI